MLSHGHFQNEVVELNRHRRLTNPSPSDTIQPTARSPANPSLRDRYGVSLSSGGPDAEILLGRRTLLSSKPTAMAAQELWTSWDDFMAQRNEDGQEARQEIPNFHHDINHHDGDVHD